MRREINNDNRYKVGIVIFAKVNPALKLVIIKYRQRIYYCSQVERPDQNNYAYFERELIPPAESEREIRFWQVSSREEINYVFAKDSIINRKMIELKPLFLANL